MRELMNLHEQRFHQLLNENKIDEINRCYWGNEIKTVKINFNYPIDNIIFPNSIKKIIFGYNFNQPVPKLNIKNNPFLPLFLEELVFQGPFNYDISKCIFPNNLKKLIMIACECYSYSLSNIILPNNLEYFSLPYNYMYPVDDIIYPNSLQTLCIYGSSCNIRRNLKISSKTELILNNPNKILNNLPSNLKILTLITIKEPLLNLPIDLEELKYYHDHDNILDKSKIPYNCKIHHLSI